MLTMSTMIGICSDNRSRKCLNLGERFLPSIKAKLPPPTASSIAHQNFWTKTDILMTIWVIAGRSAPKPLNKDSNCGTTMYSKKVVTGEAAAGAAGGGGGAGGSGPGGAAAGAG